MARLRSKLLVIAPALCVAACGDDEKRERREGDGGSKPPPSEWLAAVGDDGTLVQTFDETSWEVRSVTDVDLFGVTCVGNEQGWAAGTRGKVLSTIDAGVTWSEQDSGTTQALRAIRFSHTAADGRTLGIAAGDRGTLRASWDGGATWEVRASGTDARLVSIAMSHGRDVIVIAGDGAVVLRSTDEAASFESRTIDGAGDLSAVSVDAAGTLIAVADRDGRIWTSSDRGATFALDHFAMAPLEAVALAGDASWGVAAGPRGTLLERDRSGVWRAVEAPGEADLFAAIVSHDRDRAYAAGAGGTVLSKANPSAPWIASGVATRVTLRALEDLAPE